MTFEEATIAKKALASNTYDSGGYFFSIYIVPQNRGEFSNLVSAVYMGAPPTDELAKSFSKNNQFRLGSIGWAAMNLILHDCVSIDGKPDRT
jgi:hypothetical protein